MTRRSLLAWSAPTTPTVAHLAANGASRTLCGIKLAAGWRRLDVLWRRDVCPQCAEAGANHGRRLRGDT